MDIDTPERHPFQAPRLKVAQRLSQVFLGVFVLLVVIVHAYPATYVYPSLPRITHTSSGVAGDPVNVLLVGSKAQIVAGFTKAQWLVPDRITSQTSTRIAVDSLAHRPYRTAPVSNLYAFGRAQDLAFEWPTNDVQNRGHIRLWQTTLYIDGQPIWIGAATYDHGIELSNSTELPTHHILPTVDLERNRVGTDLAHSGLTTSEVYEPYTSPIFVAHNGGGDYYASDGQVLGITFSRVTLPSPTGLSVVDATLDRTLFRCYDAVLGSALLAVVLCLIAAGVVMLALWPVLRLL